MAKATTKQKVLLPYLLAKAVWQFYDSEWMEGKWTKDTVQFMLAWAPNGVLIHEPFLSARFDKLTKFTSQDIDDQFPRHRFPKILA